MGTLAHVPELMSGADILCAILRAEGVNVVFGYPGGAILPTYDALGRSGIHHVLVRHEQGATHMADGFARATGRVGVAIATSGPGATNVVTGLATAMADSIPMVVITGQVPSSAIGTDAFQETDILGITVPITKHNALIRRTEDIAPALREAFGIARSGRKGPVLVDITKDAQIGRAAFHDPGPYAPRPRPLPRANPEEIARAAALLMAAERPLVLCGHGVTQAGASDALIAVAERLDLPVATTLLGLGAFPANHKNQLGMMGMHGAAWVNRAIQQADLLLAVGMRFDDRVTGDPARFAPNAQIIHIEHDPAEIGKVVPTEVGLCGDALDLLTRLHHATSPCHKAAWRETLDAWRASDRPHDIITRDDGSMRAPLVMRELYKHVGSDVIVVTDVGQHQMWQAQYWEHERPRSLLTSGGLGTMGFALPAAIGAALSGRTEEIWVIAGDGGFQMTACELSTLSQEGLKLHIIILNNGFLGMVRQWQELFYERRYTATPMHNPDFCLLAQAHGIRAERVTERSQLAAAVAAARAHPGSSVIELCVTEEELVLPMVPAGNHIDDMIRRPQEIA